jgi:pyruvate kinase
MIRELVQAGMDVARVNFSHGDHPTHARTIAAIRQVADDESRSVAVMADLQGPKLRVGAIVGEGLVLKDGDQISLVPARDASHQHDVPVPHPDLLAALRKGHRVLLDDATIELVVTGAGAQRVECRVVDGGRLTSHKGINVPDTEISLPALTEKDHEDAAFAVAQGVDVVAISFVRHPDDVVELRHVLHLQGSDALIVAKIERPEALDHFDAILEVSDAIMVARGDLGVETPAEEVPFHQKRIIRACNQAGKPVITATQMLQSMIAEPRPTRAEASDVANAVLDGSDAVMLSGETAVGAYPAITARTMARICTSADAHLATTWNLPSEALSDGSITSAISRAAVGLASEVGARAIITATESGTTARMVARHRPHVPILAVTPNLQTLRRLALVWGVSPYLVGTFGTTEEMVRKMVVAAREAGYAASGDAVVLTAGVPFGKGRRTNMVRVHRVA